MMEIISHKFQPSMLKTRAFDILSDVWIFRNNKKLLSDLTAKSQVQFFEVHSTPFLFNFIPKSLSSPIFTSSVTISIKPMHSHQLLQCQDDLTETVIKLKIELAQASFGLDSSLHS